MYRRVGNHAALLLDAISLFVCGKGLHTIHHTLILPPQLAVAGHYQFLTNLSLVLSLVVFSIGIASHLLKSKSLFHLKNNLHAVVFVLESVVTVVYWPLRLFYIDMILNTGIPIPLSLDLSIHLVPAVSLFIDYIFFMPPWTITNSQAFAVIISMSSGYWALLESKVDVTAGAAYPYPFLDVPERERAIIFGGVATIAFLNYLFMKRVYSSIVSKKQVIDGKKKQ